LVANDSAKNRDKGKMKCSRGKEERKRDGEREIGVSLGMFLT
jgi:hypothetical protein